MHQAGKRRLIVYGDYQAADGYVLFHIDTAKDGVSTLDFILIFLLQKPYQSCAEFLLRTPTYKDNQHHP